MSAATIHLRWPYAPLELFMVVTYPLIFCFIILSFFSTYVFLSFLTLDFCNAQYFPVSNQALRDLVRVSVRRLLGGLLDWVSCSDCWGPISRCSPNNRLTSGVGAWRERPWLKHFWRAPPRLWNEIPPQLSEISARLCWLLPLKLLLVLFPPPTPLTLFPPHPPGPS